jgi:hypothetical protein
MVIVANHFDDVVVFAVQIHDDPTLSRHLRHEPHDIHAIAVLDFRRPLVEEDHGVGGCNIERVVER